MAETIGSRFGGQPVKAVAEMQEARGRESNEQAYNAEQLTTRLGETRAEAERLAKEEIDRSRTLQQEDLEESREWREWNRRLNEVQTAKDRWEQERAKEKQRIEADRNNALKAIEEKQRALQSWMELDRQLGETRTEMLERLNLEKANLQEAEGKLSSLQARQHDLRSRLEPLMDEQRSLTQEEERLRAEELPGIDSQLRAERQKRDQLESQRASLQQAMETEQRRAKQWEDRRVELLLLAEEARRVFGAADGIKEERQAGVHSLREQLRESENKAERAQELLRESTSVKGQALSMREERSTELRGLKQQKESLVSERNRIDEQIAVLQKRLREATEKLDLVSLHEHHLENDLSVLESDAKQAEERKKQAEELAVIARERQASLRQSLAAALRGLQEAEQRRDEAERERIDTERLYEVHYQQHRQGTPSIGDRFAGIEQNLMSSINQVAMLEQGLQDRRSRHDSIRNHLWRIDAQLKPILEENNILGAELAKLRQHVGTVQERVSHLQGQLDKISAGANQGEYQRITSEIHRLRSAAASLDDQLRQEGTNPHLIQFSQIHQERPLIEERIRETMRYHPSPALREQLNREAEAVLRAEAAAALQSRQQRIADETKKLARFQFERHPSIVVDDQATGRIVDSNLPGGEGGTYSDVAAVVVQMVEQQHIHSS